ncbi:MAG: Chloride channel protein [Labilithrix sp.]|nr:Chloride channel protein [Labilithrix sp.]
MDKSSEEHLHPIEMASTTDGLPVAPSMGPGLASVGAERRITAVGPRVLAMAAMSCAIAVVAALIAQLLTTCIALITNLAFYGRLSLAHTSPAGNTLGAAVVFVPVAGALLVGVMARYGSAAIRGHGIPEAMEQILFNQSRIPARVLLLKPLSAVISIGTGGPFGAEGPIIATGGALGSLIGQFAKISAEERKTLLASGAAAGMAATFGSPVAAVLLAIELLLFEYRARSVIPVALASVTATGIRIAFAGSAPAFAVRDLAQPAAPALLAYVGIGVVLGLASVLVTKAVYAVEDAFARLPIHWMWWPALGAIPVGLVGIIAPRTMGVGYDNIEEMVSGNLAGTALFVLCGWKLVSWLFSLGSGTSGGTLAPLFTIGGGAGAACATAIVAIAPAAGVDVRLGALVGMAAMFAGASRALLASVVFAFETTRQPVGLLPLLGGCTAAYLVSCALMKHSIMTEKIARRGRPVPSEYAADYLEQVLVRDVALRDVVTLRASQLANEVREWVLAGSPGSDHQGFPVLDAQDNVAGVVTRRDLFSQTMANATTLAELLRRAPLVISPEASLREAADVMVRERVGRLPVVADGRTIGIVTRSDLLEAHQHRLTREHHVERARRLPRKRASSLPA